MQFIIIVLNQIVNNLVIIVQPEQGTNIAQDHTFEF